MHNLSFFTNTDCKTESHKQWRKKQCTHIIIVYSYLFYIIVIKINRLKNTHLLIHNFNQEIYRLEKIIVWYMLHNIANVTI